MNEPKYIWIKTQIKDKIISGDLSVGSQISSEAELTKMFKVSRHTVRLAISELVNEGYLVKKQGLGTFVSAEYLNVQTNTTKTIGVITTYVSDYIFPSIIRGLENELSQKDYSLMLSSTHNNVLKERKSLESMLQHKVDGLVVEPTKSSELNPNLNLFLSTMQRNIPIVMLHAKYDELDIPIIAMDDEMAGSIATEHLIELGHKDIAIITKSDDQQGKKRLKGYIQTLTKNHLNYEQGHVISYLTETFDELPDKITELLKSDYVPTAFVCYNDQVAILLMQELLKKGKIIPDDFSIVSIDNSYLSTTIPSIKLTSVNHPKELMGEAVAKWMMEAIENNHFDNDSIIFEPELVIGNSTKALEE